LKSESRDLKQGDLVKIDLGAHVDGFIAIVGHSVVVGEDEVTGRKAEAVLAAYKGIQAAYRLLKPGHTNSLVT